MNQIEILQFKSTLSKIKNLVGGLKSRLEMVEEKVNEIKDDQLKLFKLKNRERKRKSSKQSQSSVRQFSII